VLKSLVALDTGGGSFGSLGYRSGHGAFTDDALAGISIERDSAFRDLVDSLQGARVTVELKGGEPEIEGRILGLEADEKRQGDDKIKEHHLVLAVGKGSLQRVALRDILRVKLNDDTLGDDLDRLLDRKLSGIKKQRTTLVVDARGTGSREIVLGYAVEAPAWKTSYRLLIGGEKEENLLQGWALVDNATAEDWREVELSLVSGLPVSFVHDLSSPRRIERPVVKAPNAAPVAGRWLEKDENVMMPSEVELDEDYQLSVEMEAAVRPAPARMAAPRARMLARAGGATADRENFANSVQAAVETKSLEQAFAYTITTPVSIPAGGSAMVPLLQQKVGGRKLLLYDAEIRGSNPMCAFELRNDTGLVLEGGPLTVFEEGSYAGETMLNTLAKDQSQIAAYAVELRVKVEVSTTSEQHAYHKVTKRGNMIYRSYNHLLRTHYRFTSATENSMHCYVNHRPTHELRHADCPEPVEEKEGLWRFECEVPAQRAYTFTVTEVREHVESIDVPGLGHAFIRDLVDGELIPDRVRGKLGELADLAEELDRQKNEIEQLKKKQRAIEADQKRLRDNLGSIGASDHEKRVRKRYLDKLEKQEDELERIAAEMGQKRRRVEDLERQIRQKVEELEDF
ncbi:MAG: DUF4139 domain-containing protein, partial [Deltaproteobacteria bacterium]